MKIIIAILLLSNLSVSNAGPQERFSIPQAILAGQNIPIEILLSTCPLPTVDDEVGYKHKIEVIGNQINFYIYYTENFPCLPEPPHTIYLPFDLGELNSNNYTITLYFLFENITFPLPDNYPLSEVDSTQFNVLAPQVIDLLSKSNIHILLLLLLGFGYQMLRKNAEVKNR